MSIQPGLTIVADSGVTVLSLDKPYDLINEVEIETLQHQLLDACDAADPPCVVMDMSQVEFFGSSFIEVLFRVWNRINARNGKFAISGLTKYCHEVLEVTNLDKLWALYDSRAEAVSGISSN